MGAIIAVDFPIVILYGFCFSAGVYMNMPLYDKTTKMRQYIFLQGVSPQAYFLGLFIADYALFFASNAIFIVIVEIAQVPAFTTQIGAFIAMMSVFGLVLIPLTYNFQHFFKDANESFRKIGMYYLMIAILLPIMFELVLKDLGTYIMFYINPFYTFS